ncbi:outer membrane beta-barrel protein [Leptobacterium flavescens]|uniref:Outer membrane beta-barrel protein n=1 Tax=Leptobacterium flavescens TaxID=472055 RepID=A0A6P0UHL8_9FLAO|nr:porin family protein [Leptobacterium flavescens]NER12734.1 outer membrane beta-barrel protein [Leptobacterium flavescens]
MRFYLPFLFVFIPFLSLAQDTSSGTAEVNNRYLEDQFYVGITYNLLLNRPSGVSQSNLPYGLQLGYIKDIPINAERNIGFGIGLGYNFNSYSSNLQAIEENGEISYQLIADDVQFNRNKLITHMVEVPIEFRWRTSSPENYKFWRVYGGVRLGYVFANSSKFISDAERLRFSNDDLERFQYDLYFSFGYNTWNFYASYALNNVFKNDVVTVDGERIEMRSLKIGLIFYIL